jgi:hypothetical protein
MFTNRYYIRTPLLRPANCGNFNKKKITPVKSRIVILSRVPPVFILRPGIPRPSISCLVSGHGFNAWRNSSFIRRREREASASRIRPLIQPQASAPARRHPEQRVRRGGRGVEGPAFALGRPSSLALSSLFPVPCSLFLVPCSLCSVPCSLFLSPENQIAQFQTHTAGGLLG